MKKGGITEAPCPHLHTLDPATLWDLRTRIGATLNAAKLPPKNKLFDLRTPARDVSILPDIGDIKSPDR